MLVGVLSGNIPDDEGLLGDSYDEHDMFMQGTNKQRRTGENMVDDSEWGGVSESIDS